MMASRRRSLHRPAAVRRAVVLLLATSLPAAAFTAPVVVTDQDVGEPGIDVAADGTLYVNAPVGLLSSLPGAASLLFRSDDGGASWIRTDPGLRANLPGGGDSDVALSPSDGTVYFTDLYLAESTVSVSHDKGATWAFANPVGGAPVHDRQWLCAPGGSDVYHVYDQIPTGLWVSHSIDGGMTYALGSLAATPVDRTGFIGPPGTMVCEAGAGMLGTGNRVGVIYANSTGGVGFARSTNGGVTWTQVLVSSVDGADTTGGFPIVADAGNGRLAAVWMEFLGGRSRVRFSSSVNFGGTWSAPATLVSAGTSLYPWVDARGGKISVALYHSDAEATPDTVPEESLWYVKYLESTGGAFTPLAVVDPTPVKSGPICVEGLNCSGDRELLDFLSVAIDPALRANVVWTRSIDGESDTEVRYSRQ
jgi:hypothetical protein